MKIKILNNLTKSYVYVCHEQYNCNTMYLELINSTYYLTELKFCTLLILNRHTIYQIYISYIICTLYNKFDIIIR